MYAPYTANDLVRVMEHDLEERHAAAELSRRRLLPGAGERIPASAVARRRFANMLLRFTGSVSSN